MWELNKVHTMSVQSLGDKENKLVVQNQLKSFKNGSLVHSYTLSILLLYNDTNIISFLSYISRWVC